MQTLLRSLQDHDLGHLRIVAELWNVELRASQVHEAASELAQAMLLPESLTETIDSLAAEPRQALQVIQTHGGRIPWADLERRFGSLREMGPGRRDREKPHRATTSSTEALWYRGLVARAFADTPTGPQEFAFIPDDLARSLPLPGPPLQLLGEPAPVPRYVLLGGATAVEDAVTLLASLRRTPLRQSPPPRTWFVNHYDHLYSPDSAPLLVHLLTEQRILTSRPLQPHPEAVRAFLEAPRGLAVTHLASAWASSAGWNDLAQVPDLRPADAWPNDPLASRQSALALLHRVPRDRWWGLASFVSAVQREETGFLRPGGSFSTWYLRRPESESFMMGVDHWDAIDGAYLRHLICGPLHWLGLLDLGGEGIGEPPLAFRWTTQSGATAETAVRASLSPDGMLRVPRQAPSTLRYQLARLGAWGRIEEAGYLVRLEAGCLRAAREQGLQPSQMVSLLESATGAPLPGYLRKAIERGATHGTEARLETRFLLRVDNRRILEELQRSRATARWLGERLGPSVVAVAASDWPALRAAAARLGILLEGPPES